MPAGNTRGGKAVFYTTDVPPALAAAQLVKRQLVEIGLEVEVKALPIHIATAAYVGKLAARGEPWDIALVLWTPNFIDPFAYVNAMLDRQFIGGTNLARFESSGYDQRAAPGAARVASAGDRNRAYGSSTCGSRATRPRSRRSMFSARRRWSRHGSAASCCARCSTSPPSV